MSDKIVLNPLVSYKFSLRMGLAPDLCKTIRGAIEKALRTLTLDSTAVIETTAIQNCQVDCI